MSATIEERLTALEEWKNMQNGLLEATNTHLGEMNDLFRTHERRFAAVEERLASMNGRLDGMDRRLDGVDRRLDGLGGRLDGLDGRLDGVDGRLEAIEEKLEKLAVTVQTGSTGIDAKLEILIELLRPKIVG